MNKHRSLCLVACLLLSTVLTGCWDSVEVNNSAMLLEFAIDKNTAYTYDPAVPNDERKVLKMTYSIPDFGKLTGNQSVATEMERVTKVEAPSIDASIDDIEIQSKDTVNFNHVKALFLGEALLKDKELMRETVDTLARNMLFARNVPLLAVNGDAGLTADVEDTSRPILGLYILDYFNNSQRPVSYFQKQLLGNFIRQLKETGVTTLPVFHVEELAKKQAQAAQKQSVSQQAGGQEAAGQASGAASEADPMGEAAPTGDAAPAGDTKPPTIDKVDISGGAVIKDYALVGYITKEEVRGQLFVQGKIKNAPVVAYYQGSPISYTIKNQSRDIKFKDTPEGPTCFIGINVKGDITSYSGEENLSDTETVEAVRAALAQAVIEQVQVGIQKAKEMNVDFLRLGVEMYRKDTAMWDIYREAWHEDVFQNMPIEIGVRVVVESTGLQE